MTFDFMILHVDIALSCRRGHHKLEAILIVGAESPRQKDGDGGKGSVDQNPLEEGYRKVGIGGNVVGLGSGRHGEK